MHFLCVLVSLRQQFLLFDICLESIQMAQQWIERGMDICDDVFISRREKRLNGFHIYQ